MLERTFTRRCFAISSFVRLNFLSLTPLEGRLCPHYDYEKKRNSFSTLNKKIRILNRLSCDMFVIDQKLPSCLQVSLKHFNWVVILIYYSWNSTNNQLHNNPQRLLLVTLICLSSLAVNCIQVSLVFFTLVFDIIVFLLKMLPHLELQSPIFILCAVPITAAYWWVQHFYRCSSRELQVKL